MNNIKVNKQDNIVSYLNNLKIGKNKVKSLVKNDCIYVNNKLVSKLPYIVNIGDIISIGKRTNNDIDIVYEDDNYLVVNKKCGLLTISTDSKNKNSEITLYKLVRKYLNDKKERVFIVNRIDKETSGLVMFTKNEKLKTILQDNWNNIVTKRKYIAIVSGQITHDGRIDNYLYEDKLTFVHQTKYGGKRAITNYHVVKSNGKYTLLDIDIETGRKNQIRVHMSQMHHPIVGDKKYYSKDNTLGRLCLHHYELSLIDPISKKKVVFKCPIPDIFKNIFNAK